MTEWPERTTKSGSTTTFVVAALFWSYVMPRKSSVPSYRLHKASGQARTIVDGRHIYLGKYGSPESRQQYARILAEVALPAGIPTTPDISRSQRLLVSELLVAYLKFAESYYSIEGQPTNEFRNMVDAVGPLNQLYGDTQADEFGPLKLKAVREHLVKQGLCRTETNKRIGRLKRAFKWAVSEELTSPSVHQALSTVTSLKFGRTSARESEPVKPVEEGTIELTLPYVTPQIAAMIRLQLLTGMRPGEVIRMQPCDIDTSTDVWIYVPTRHKGRWRGHQRTIPLGPHAQQQIEPFMKREETAFLFSPAEADEYRHECRAIHRNRKTPVYPCELRAREKRKQKAKSRKPKRPKGNCYTPDSYRRAIKYGVTRSNRERTKADSEAVEIAKWSPYQLRHSFATNMRRDYGVEAAQLGLGHARTNIVDVYAEKNLSLIVDIARKNG
jgi:integrase